MKHKGEFSLFISLGAQTLRILNSVFWTLTVVLWKCDYLKKHNFSLSSFYFLKKNPEQMYKILLLSKHTLLNPTTTASLITPV